MNPAPITTTATPSTNLPPLQPRGIFGILGAAIRVYRAIPLLLLGIVVPLELPLALANSYVSTLNPLQGLDVAHIYDRGNIISLFVFAFFRILLLLVEVLVSFIVLAAITHALSQRYLGRPSSVGEAYRRVLPRFGALMGGVAAVIGAGIVSIVFIIILAVFLTLIGLDVSEEGGFKPGPGGLPLPIFQAILVSTPVVLLIGYLLLRWSMIVQVVMVETAPANQALRRSWRLVGGRFWQVAATLLLAVAPAILLTTVAPLLLPFVTTEQSGWGVLVFDLTAYLLRLLLLPFGFVALALLYFDLRMRKEGFTLYTLAAEMGQPQ